MTENLTELAADVVAFLMNVDRDRAAPREAQARLRALQARHREVELELVWEAEAYDGSLHYDILFRAPGRGTVSISFAGEHGLPWPLRGVKRSSDANLVQVNGKMLTMEEAVTFLDILWNEAPLMERMVNACLVREELERSPIELGDDELQRGMDGFRRAHGLCTVDDTVRWMQRRGLTHEQLEQQVTGTLMCAKLRRRLAEGRVEGYFESNQGDFDVAHVARIECADQAAARRVIEASARPAPIAGLAHEGALRIQFERIRRRDVQDGLRDVLFQTPPGEPLGPINVGDRVEVMQVIAVERATFDSEVREAIEQIIFDDWLAERRSTARVCWHWGHPERALSAA